MMLPGRRLFFTAISVYGLASSALAQSAAPPEKLEGLAYARAFDVIVGFGWSPAAGECTGGGTTDEICANHPEIRNCSGTGVGYCHMQFAKPDRCLTVFTYGGPPSKGSDTVVDRVEFSKASCPAERFTPG